MNAFRIENFSFSYPQSSRAALSNINLTITAGSFALLCGLSGSGKSTLLRQLKPALAPVGTKTGEIYFFDKPLDELAPIEQAARIGFVLQDIESQIVTDKVWHELAFGLESLGTDNTTIRLRVAETAGFFGLQGIFEQNTAELSGGQKQLLNLASVMVTEPEVLILDEPCAQLDPLAAADFLEALVKINRELGTTIILSEQRLEEIWPLAQQVIVLEQGCVWKSGTLEECAQKLWQSAHPLYQTLPTAFLLQKSIEPHALPIFTVAQGRNRFKAYFSEHPVPSFTPSPTLIDSETVLKLKEIHFNYPHSERDILKGLTLTLHKGEFLALLGTNGVGKSTALAVIAELFSPSRGQISRKGRIAFLPQDPQSIFAKSTVRQELEEIFPPSERRLPQNIAAVEEIITLCALASFLDRHPYDLSGGEQERTALAKVLLLKPDILLLDEPTKGLDYQFKQELAAILKQLQSRGTAILMASHDVSFCAAYCDSCALFFNGQLISQAEPHEFFSANRYFTTPTNRLLREYLPQVITVDEAASVLGGQMPSAVSPPSMTAEPLSGINSPKSAAKSSIAHRRSVLAAFSILLLIPLTIFIGIHYWQDRQYSLISMLILGECLLPFFLIFEGRRPKARELVLIAVFCALAIAGRALFFMLPQFKPVMAVVIIAGISLGAESGFLVGALSMLVSNMFFGMGPWTPWQMFAMGLIGFLAGIIFNGLRQSRRRLPVCLFGALAAVIVYGGIMNPAAAIMSRQTLNLPVLLSYYAMGLPMDLIQALATFIFLWLLAEPVFEKMDRIKLKYGLLK